jgi:hypothetical protein
MAAVRVCSWPCRDGHSQALMSGLLASFREVECVGVVRSPYDGRRRRAPSPPSALVGVEDASVQ